MCVMLSVVIVDVVFCVVVLFYLGYLMYKMFEYDCKCVDNVCGWCVYWVVVSVWMVV